MNLDEALDAWRSQDQSPLYSVDEGRLQQALREEEARRRRGLVLEARVTYGLSALIFAGLALVFALMLYDDDPRTWWDFLIVTFGVAAAVFAAANLYIGRTRLALRERHFGASLHHELGRHVALLNYELSRTWRVSAITRTMLPFYLCTLALYLSIWRINNEPFKWGTDGFPLLVMSGDVVRRVDRAARGAGRAATKAPARRAAGEARRAVGWGQEAPPSARA